MPRRRVRPVGQARGRRPANRDLQRGRIRDDLTLADAEFCCQTDGAGNCLNCQVPETAGVCPVEYKLIQADWTEYVDPTWVFNIADFAGYLWDLDTTGAFVVQLRFYPMK